MQLLQRKPGITKIFLKTMKVRKIKKGNGSWRLTEAKNLFTKTKKFLIFYHYINNVTKMDSGHCTG